MNIKNEIIKLEVELENAGTRVDLYLADLLENVSRSRIQSLIDDGNVLVNEKVPRRAYKLRFGDLISMELPPDKPLELTPEDISLNIVYEDSDLLVINKPAGMLTHPAPGQYSGTLVNALLYHCRDSLSGINGILRPGIVHRLDKDTTGLIVVAKNDLAHQKLAQQFKDRTIDKYYVAVVQGNIKEDSGVINAPIDRNPVKRGKMAVIEDGKPAVTYWRVLERFRDANFVEAKLLTGRTHQLRVHFSHIKHPILGDPVYGNPKSQKIKLDRQALQAYKISFDHPRSNDKLSFEIEYDDVIKKLLKIYNSHLIEREEP